VPQHDPLRGQQLAASPRGPLRPACDVGVGPVLERRQLRRLARAPRPRSIISDPAGLRTSANERTLHVATQCWLAQARRHRCVRRARPQTRERHKQPALTVARRARPAWPASSSC
jgi:hypothetical protein